jgi:hypothetical protein
MIDITESFLRTLHFRLDECSTYAQFREFFVKNKSILYNNESYSLFSSRLTFLRESCSDRTIRKMCDDLQEDMESERGIVSPSGGKPSKGSLPLSLNFNTDEGSVLRDAVTEVIRAIYFRAKGKRKEVSRILGISTDELDALIDNDKLRKRVILETKKSFKVLKD